MIWEPKTWVLHLIGYTRSWNYLIHQISKAHDITIVSVTAFPMVDMYEVFQVSYNQVTSKNAVDVL